MKEIEKEKRRLLREAGRWRKRRREMRSRRLGESMVVEGEGRRKRGWM